VSNCYEEDDEYLDSFKAVISCYLNSLSAAEERLCATYL
jgi:hypothetical protein